MSSHGINNRTLPAAGGLGKSEGRRQAPPIWAGIFQPPRSARTLAWAAT